MPRAFLTVAEARRIALAAQGFARPRPRRADLRHLRSVVAGLGLVQLDFVNVLVPAHYLVPFSRIGAYDRRLLDELAYRRRELVEQWAHEASLVAVDDWPLLRARVGDRRGRHLATFDERHRAYVERVIDEVRARGPLAADELEAPPAAPRPDRRSWGWTMQRAALEAHFLAGDLAVADRRADLARRYDLAERVVGARHAARVAPDEALRRLTVRAARALGVATAADLADYYRLPVRLVRAHAAEILEAVTVEGWREPAYLAPGAAPPRRVAAAALLSPFDPLVWYRPRAARLFGFDYRIEIYTPPAKRRWGYYVLPFLLGERIVARVDLRADRAAGRLVVAAAHAEPGARGVRDPLLAELRALAAWLGLDDVVIGRRGDLARSLR